ncbi:hypothetical protein SK128_027107, partial [Halocaridina rubra]
TIKCQWPAVNASHHKSTSRRGKKRWRNIVGQGGERREEWNEKMEKQNWPRRRKMRPMERKDGEIVLAKEKKGERNGKKGWRNSVGQGGERREEWKNGKIKLAKEEKGEEWKERMEKWCWLRRRKERAVKKWKTKVGQGGEIKRGVEGKVGEIVLAKEERGKRNLKKRWRNKDK